MNGDPGMLTLCGRLSYPLVWDFALTAGSLSGLLGDLSIEQAWDVGPVPGRSVAPWLLAQHAGPRLL